MPSEDPPPPDPRVRQPPRPSSGGARLGTPPLSAGLARSASVGFVAPSLQQTDRPLPRPLSAGSVRGELLVRRPSLDRLQPLPPGSPVLPPGGAFGSGPPSRASRPNTTERLGDAASAENVPPPPQPLDEASARRSKAEKYKAPPGDAGPMKWVPHTHTNPKHAKFCFICLQGRLDGEAKGDDDAKVKIERQIQDQDLPAQVDMNERGYLIPGKDHNRFRRAGADFQRNNLSAVWLQGVSKRAYHATCKDLVEKQNGDIMLGRDVKLVDWDEDKVDRDAVERLWRSAPGEDEALEERNNKLGLWCVAQEDRLMDMKPPAQQHESLPEVFDPTKEQLSLMEYQPLIDHSKFKGDTAFDAKETVRMADALAAVEGGFLPEALPRPKTYVDMPAFEVVPFKVSLADVPAYEPLAPHPLVRKPLGMNPDPFEAPLLMLPEFEENTMPEFRGTAGIGKARGIAPVAAPEHWVTKTDSIFADNNEQVNDNDVGFGRIPSRKRLMLAFIDEPYLPPVTLTDSDSGKKRVLVRTIWDPELFTQDGNMVPPLPVRAKALYIEPHFVHITDPLWSSKLAPMKKREAKITDIINIVPLRSYARFKPRPIAVNVPDFLWDVVRKDASAQDIWDIIVQRHEIPRQFREAQALALEMANDVEAEEARAAEAGDALQQESLELMLSDGGFNGSTQPEVTAAEGFGHSAGEEDEVEPTLPAPALSTVQAEQGDGFPAVEIEVPGPPLPATIEAAIRQTDLVSRPSSAADRERKLREHKQRVRELPISGSEGRKAEELLADDRFIDTLADRLCQRLGGTATSMTGMIASTMPAATAASGVLGSWASGLQGGTMDFHGQSTQHRRTPAMPTFVEPTDEASRAELPKALQGRTGALGQSQKLGSSKAFHNEAVTLADVNQFTQEKMRGDCYVRLLMKPEANAARKVPQPYKAQNLPPDPILAMKENAPRLRMPPRSPRPNEDGELEEEDEFADYEPNFSILFSFVRHNKVEKVKQFLQQEYSYLTEVDENKNTLLHISCQNNHRRMAKLLVDQGIDVNYQNDRGNTALHYCYIYKFHQLAEYLMQHEADDTIMNKDGLPPSQAGEAASQQDPIGSMQKNLSSQ